MNNSAAPQVDEIRIAKDGGFFGVSLPIVRCMFGTTPQTAANYTTPFFIANRPYRVISITERHQVAGSDAGAVTCQVKKVPSGTAPASGTNLLATAFNMKATADTNQTGALSAVQGALTISSGDSICLESSGTLTALVGVTVSVLLRAV